MRLPQTKCRLWWLMVAVAVAVMALWAERMWRRREFYLERAEHHGFKEAWCSNLAMDLAGVPRQPPSKAKKSLLPDGTGVEFVNRGPSRQIFQTHVGGTKELADEATIEQFVMMCNEAAAEEREMRRVYEWYASHPWLSFDPSTLGPQ
jgi:hypothetical protein